MPDTSKYNLAYRPPTYWETPDAIFANIKGERRRRYLKKLLKQGRGEQTDAGLFADSLSDREREALGRVHPMLMGGEYLPEYEPGEVEVARVSLQSTTGDVISIRARRQGDVIRYRVVDEYETAFKCAPEETRQPLTLGELIGLIDGVHEEPSSGYGLTSRFRDANLVGGGDPGRLVDFVTVSSPFYPELERYYEEEAQEWLRAVKARVGDEPSAEEEYSEARQASAQARKDHSLSHFDGYPYLVIRLIAGVFQIQVVPRELPREAVIALARKLTRERKLRHCVVFGPQDAVYCEPDGTESHSTEPPRGGFVFTASPSWTRPPEWDLRERAARATEFAEAQWGQILEDYHGTANPLGPKGAETSPRRDELPDPLAGLPRVPTPEAVTARLCRALRLLVGITQLRRTT